MRERRQECSARPHSDALRQGGRAAQLVTVCSDITALSTITTPHVRNSAEDAATLKDSATNIWPVGITGSSVLTAVSSVASFSNAAAAGVGGVGITFLSVTNGVQLSAMANVSTPTHGYWDEMVLTSAGVPANAKTAILTIMYEKYGKLPTPGGFANDQRGIFYVSGGDGAASVQFEAASVKVAGSEMSSATSQFFCPIFTANNSISIKVNESWKYLTYSNSRPGKWRLAVVGYVI